MMGNGVTTLAASFLIGSPFFAGKKDNHKSLDEFEFQAGPTSDCGVIWKNPHKLTRKDML